MHTAFICSFRKLSRKEIVLIPVLSHWVFRRNSIARLFRLRYCRVNASIPCKLYFVLIHSSNWCIVYPVWSSNCTTFVFACQFRTYAPLLITPNQFPSVLILWLVATEELLCRQPSSALVLFVVLLNLKEEVWVVWAIQFLTVFIIVKSSPTIIEILSGSSFPYTDPLFICILPHVFHPESVRMPLL